MGGGVAMGKHHRKWYIDEPIAQDFRLKEMIEDLEEYYEEEEQ